MIEAVIFDVDGTLIDTVDYHARAWLWAFARHGHDVPFEDIRAQIGKGGDQLMPVFLSEEEIDKIGEKLSEDRDTFFKGEYLPHVHAFPMVRELFERILADGKKIVLASSAKEEELKKYEKIARVDGLISGSTSSDDSEKSKPHPDIFQAALAKLGGLDPSKAIVIGDTPWDAIAAGPGGLEDDRRPLRRVPGGRPQVRRLRGDLSRPRRPLIEVRRVADRGWGGRLNGSLVLADIAVDGQGSTSRALVLSASCRASETRDRSAGPLGTLRRTFDDDLGLRTVIYRVDDLDRAKDWYRDVFEQEPYFDQPFYVGFQIGGFEMGLDPDKSEGKPGPGGSVAYWGVDSIEAAVARFVGRGASPLTPINEVGGGIKVATLSDPFGNTIGLIENPHFASPGVGKDRSP